MKGLFAAVGSVIGALIGLLALPLMVLNTLGGIIAGVWLIAVGEWKQVLFGVGFGLVATLLIAVILLPGMLIAAPGLALMQRRPLMALPFALGSLLWTYLVMTVWSLLIFAHFVEASHGAHVLPFVLLAYATATSPWGYLAEKERRTDPDAAAVLAALVMQFANVGIIVSIWLGRGEQSVFGMVVFAVPVMALGLLLQLAVAFEGMMAARRQAW